MLTKLLLIFGISFLIQPILSQMILTLKVGPSAKNESQEQRAYYRSSKHKPSLCSQAITLESRCNKKVAPILQNLIRLQENIYYISPPITNTNPGLNWHQAQDFCRRYDMQLLSVETTTEDLMIRNHINTLTGTIKKFWTGLNDLTTEGSYYWVGIGESAWQTMSMAAPAPSGDTADCGQLIVQGSSVIWDDQLCSDKTRFICEMDCPCDGVISVI